LSSAGRRCHPAVGAVTRCRCATGALRRAADEARTRDRQHRRQGDVRHAHCAAERRRAGADRPKRAEIRPPMARPDQATNPRARRSLRWRVSSATARECTSPRPPSTSPRERRSGRGRARADHSGRARTPGKRRTLALARTGRRDDGLRCRPGDRGLDAAGAPGKSRKTDDDGSPCARGCCARVLANRYGLDARDARASLGFASDGSACSGTTGIDFDVESIPSRSGGQDAVTYV
jgi:hypothetical protein